MKKSVRMLLAAVSIAAVGAAVGVGNSLVSSSEDADAQSYTDVIYNMSDDETLGCADVSHTDFKKFIATTDNATDVKFCTSVNTCDPNNGTGMTFSGTLNGSNAVIAASGGQVDRGAVAFRDDAAWGHGDRATLNTSVDNDGKCYLKWDSINSCYKTTTNEGRDSALATARACVARLPLN